MSAASDRVQAALAALDEKAKAHIAKRSEAAAAASDFAAAQLEVDAALDDVKAEKKATVDSTIPIATVDLVAQGQ